MTSPMAHFNQWMMGHNDPRKWPVIKPEERMAVERGVYHWLHSLRIDLEQRDAPGDRIVADFIVRMQGGYGFLPDVLLPEEDAPIQKALVAGALDEKLDPETYERLYDKLLGGRYDQTHPNGHDGDEYGPGRSGGPSRPVG